ncbi:MAG: cellulase family glycosylhydrolase [Patescibacteria group bacterium]|nr:cellulase family glycosylhydrolase [Patescibacteria group bacterium]
MGLILKIIGLTLAGFISLILLLFAAMWVSDELLQVTQPQPQVAYGVTFSNIYTQGLELNQDQVYQAIISDLGVKLIRLPVYWNIIQNQPDKFDFSEYDKMLDLAAQHHVKVVLAIGKKLPRWPECFVPTWAATLPANNQQAELNNALIQTVHHFQNRPEVVAWQVENEPLFDFGQCSTIDSQVLSSEVSLVRSLDLRPIWVTDSGEVGLWVKPMQLGDYMGASVYRATWNPIFGNFHYPLPPLYYTWKAALIKILFAPSSRGVIISELQAEPWTPGTSIIQTPIQTQLNDFSLQTFQDSVHYADHTYLGTEILWGVEWWYYMKEHGHPEYWNYAKTLFNGSTSF